MSTIPIRCPKCGKSERVSVQPSRIKLTGNRTDGQLYVEFDKQTVAHTCKDV